jgi:hypothetical protein
MAKGGLTGILEFKNSDLRFKIGANGFGLRPIDDPANLKS